MMRFIYALINTAILVFALVFFARKPIAGIFKGRLERIDSQLDEAEELERTNAREPGVSAAQDLHAPEADEALGGELAQLEGELEETIGNIRKETENAERNLHKEMLASVRDDFADALGDRMAQLFSEEPGRSLLAKKQAATARGILDAVKLTPGDMSYMVNKGELYVTVTCARPLEQSTLDMIKDHMEKLIAEAGGKMSLLVREDPSAIGGFRLKVGDTVYGSSTSDEIYFMKDAMRRRQLSGGEELSDFLSDAKDCINTMDLGVRTYQTGHVLTISDGICWMDGLADIMYGEVVEFESGDRGMVLDIRRDRIGCIIYGSYERIESGHLVRRVGRIAAVPAGEELLGRVVDPLGHAIDGRGRIWTTNKRPIELPAPAILDRAAVSRPLHTGIKSIDALVPIGKGQRELIIGDRQTGKSSIVIDTILAQKGTGTVCVYVAIGQKDSTVAEVRARLEEHGALDYCTIVSAPASSSASLQYIAPFAGTAMAEEFMYKGRDALIIYDDLSKHAVAYRELSLLLHRPAGREAYPGDVFYLHSRLLERAAQLSPQLGGGSLTALPIIETQAGDISAYIPTNVISITDGQIFLESELFNTGQRPAVNVGLSVSRVGGAAQTPLMKQTAASLRTRLAQYRELSSFAQFGAELDSTSASELSLGERLMAVLRQRRFAPMPDWQQCAILYAVQNGWADSVEPQDIEGFGDMLCAQLEAGHPDIVGMLTAGKKLTDDDRRRLDEALAAALRKEEAV